MIKYPSFVLTTYLYIYQQMLLTNTSTGRFNTNLCHINMTK